MSAGFPRLFAPIALGRRQAPNRIMRLATTCNLGAGYEISDRSMAYYQRVARGGAGMLVTESMRVHASDTRSPTAIALYRPEVVPGLARLAETVQREGPLLLGQLNHAGRQNLGRGTPVLLAPSAIGCPRTGGTPHGMTAAEVEEMIAGFVTAARHCQQAGLAGVEVHGAQGHLIGQFLSPYSNARDDRWGGDAERRLNFARDILRGIRALGGDLVLGFRLGVEEFSPGGLDVAMAEEIAATLTREGLVDYLSLAQGNFNSIEQHLPDRHFPPTPFSALHQRVREAANGVPCVTSSRVQDAASGERLLAEGVADIAGYCRAFIADPAWPAKLQGRAASAVRPCIACNQCWGWISEGAPIACAVNPGLLLPEATPTPLPRHVVVVGGGPGGMQAACEAAERGHRVTLLEAGPTLGGRLRQAEAAPAQSEVGGFLRHLVERVEAAGVTLRLNSPATAESIAALAPDAVVLASGALPVPPELPGDGSVPVLAALPEALPVRSGPVVVMDEEGYFWAAALAEGAAARGLPLLIASRFFEVLRDLPVVTRIATLRALDQAGAQLRPNMAVAAVRDGGVVLRHYLSGREEFIADCPAILWAGQLRANDALAATLRARYGDRLHLIGDAYQPRRLPDALREGLLAGQRI